ncbi:MAG: hypothetical protein R3F49_04175 [Planctomycetota bacterium]
MRDAIAELDGIDKQDIIIDDVGKTATVGLDEGDPTPEAICGHFADIKKYKLRVRG